TKPTTGVVRVQGRISALIELGAGFHPEISGRENVFINGIMLGLTKQQIQARFDDIVEFAGMREFIDAPAKTYSSGMYMRRGFAATTARAVGGAEAASATPTDMFQATEGRWGSREVEIADVALLDTHGEPSFVFRSGEPMSIRLRVRAAQPTDDFVFGVGLFNA